MRYNRDSYSIAHVVAIMQLKAASRKTGQSFDAKRLATFRRHWEMARSVRDAYADQYESELRRLAACLIAGVPAEA